MSDEKKKDNGAWWGIILIAVGAVFLLRNFGLIGWSWYALWQMWPVLLLVWGIGALNVDERVKRMLVAVIIGAALVWVMGGFGNSPYGMMQPDRMMRFPGGHMYWR